MDRVEVLDAMAELVFASETLAAKSLGQVVCAEGHEEDLPCPHCRAAL